MQDNSIIEEKLIQHARKYLEAKLSVLPARRDCKRPAVGSWKQYQRRLPTTHELDAWFANSHDGLCIITGGVSGNLEILDFDNGGELFDAWHKRIPQELCDRLVIERSPSGGWHVCYRCEVKVSGNLKLAQRKQDSNAVTLIETRGEGGLFLCAPTSGYELMQGDFSRLAVLTGKERNVLLEAAWNLNEYTPELVSCSSESFSQRDSLMLPGDDYNARVNISILLKEHGWEFVKEDGVNQFWRRPGKTRGHSATLRKSDNCFYIFSSNAYPFEPDKSYMPFAVYTLLEHRGDFNQAASELARQGFGEQVENKASDVDLSGLLNRLQEDEDDAVSLTQLFEEFEGLNEPVIHGLLREGETMNIIASPKAGKSWLVNSLAIAIGSGMDWLGFKTNPGKVLHIDNELHINTITYRYGKVSEAIGVPTKLYSDNLRIKSLRGRLKDLKSLGTYFSKIPAGTYKAIIIDAFYRTLPVDTDENDNGAIANLYNLIDGYAAKIGCAFILIHHASKGNQSMKSVTDVGAGAGSQSRAADTHLVLRRHEEEDCIVMDAAVRSWPPVEPVVLRKQHPLFILDEEADPTALLGAVKHSESQRMSSLGEFVETCIASIDPCSQRLIVREARDQYCISERRAKEMIDKAMFEGLITRIKVESKMKYVKIRDGVSGEKAQWVAAVLSHNPEIDNSKAAQTTGVSERYIRKLKTELNRN